MALKFFALAVLITIIGSESTVPVATSDSTYDPHPQYYFGYDVQDVLTGDSKSQVETRNGDIVLGQYSLNDPDGTRRIVDYSSDSVNGFNAVVRKAPLGVATPIVATAALTPLVQPAAVRSVSTPLVTARGLPTASANPLPSSDLQIRSGPSHSNNVAPSTPLPPGVLSRSAQSSSPTLLTSSSSASSSIPPHVSSLLDSFNFLQSFRSLSSSSSNSSDSRSSSNLLSSASSVPSSRSLFTFSLSSAPTPLSSPEKLNTVLSSSRSLSSPTQLLPSNSSPSSDLSRSSSSGPFPSVSLFRSGPLSPTSPQSQYSPFNQLASDAIETRAASPTHTLNSSAEPRSTPIDSRSVGPPAARNSPVVANAQVVTGAPIGYAAVPGFAYAGLAAPLTYNVW